MYGDSDVFFLQLQFDDYSTNSMSGCIEPAKGGSEMCDPHPCDPWTLGLILHLNV